MDASCCAGLGIDCTQQTALALSLGLVYGLRTIFLVHCVTWTAARVSEAL